MVRFLFARLAAVACVAALLLFPRSAAAQRQSGIQVDPSGFYILVSKDVGQERWSIVYDMVGLTVLGNVFPQDGSSPKFVSCVVLNESPSGDLTLDCAGADACTASPCDDRKWTELGVVNLSGSFFAPPS